MSEYYEIDKDQGDALTADRLTEEAQDEWLA